MSFRLTEYLLVLDKSIFDTWLIIDIGPDTVSTSIYHYQTCSSSFPPPSILQNNWNASISNYCPGTVTSDIPTSGFLFYAYYTVYVWLSVFVWLFKVGWKRIKHQRARVDSWDSQRLLPILDCGVIALSGCSIVNTHVHNARAEFARVPFLPTVSYFFTLQTVTDLYPACVTVLLCRVGIQIEIITILWNTDTKQQLCSAVSSTALHWLPGWLALCLVVFIKEQLPSCAKTAWRGWWMMLN